MFDIEKNKSEHDPLRAQFQGMKGKLCASAELKAALKSGTPLHTPVMGKRVHVRRFSKAIAVYAVCALLLLGTAIALPSLLNGKGPTPATLQEEMLSPGQLYEQLLSAPNVVYREVGTVYFQDGSVETSHVTEMTRRGDLFTTLNYGEGEPQNVRYYDVGAYEPCVYYRKSDSWLTSELRGDRATWAYWCTMYMEVNWFEEEHYKKTNDCYVFTEEFNAEQMKIFKCEDLEGTLTEKDGVYTLRVMWHNEQFREEITDNVLEIQISFGNAPEIVLPEATICTHEYEVEVIPSEHPCRYGDETRYTCKICNDQYNEWSPTIPHTIVDGVCTVCGMEGLFPDLMCVHDQNPAACPYCLCDEHVWITSEDSPTCTEGITKVSTCIKCGYSYTEWQDPIGHNVVNGICTGCNLTEEVIGKLHHSDPNNHE